MIDRTKLDELEARYTTNDYYANGMFFKTTTIITTIGDFVFTDITEGESSFMTVEILNPIVNSIVMLAVSLSV